MKFRKVYCVQRIQFDGQYLALTIIQMRSRLDDDSQERSYLVLGLPFLGESPATNVEEDSKFWFVGIPAWCGDLLSLM
ncbi:hypothetical protein AKJ16_DCAP06322 [Drosera capensis]